MVMLPLTTQSLNCTFWKSTLYSSPTLSVNYRYVCTGKKGKSDDLNLMIYLLPSGHFYDIIIPVQTLREHQTLFLERQCILLTWQKICSVLFKQKQHSKSWGLKVSAVRAVLEYCGKNATFPCNQSELYICVPINVKCKVIFRNV